ncbi:hypothetical protein TWF694_006856 [Orbilia ellipsospora]|uniref:Yeast cell wall synthesis Kre9/Knh1-like N-terminal domain-containing protein n=1 Tax=Orbilia ellipsospora TaxID=2528407 RepID=A0AAV9XLG5_9PEZI
MKAPLLFTILSSILLPATYAQLDRTTGPNSIFAPNASTDVVAGSAFLIQWSDVTGEKLTVDLLLADDSAPHSNWSVVMNIVDGLSNTGSYSWGVPYGIYNFDPSNILSAIRISYNNQPDEWSYSDEFFLKQTVSASSGNLGNGGSSSSSSPASPSSTPPPSSTVPQSSTSTNNPNNSKSSSKTSSPASTSNTSPASSSSGSGAPSTKSSSNTGVIAGSVIGSVAVVIIGGIGAFWVISRERRKKAAVVGKPAPQASMPPDPNNQSIWNGNEVYSYNPNKETPDIVGGESYGYAQTSHRV